MAEDKAPHTEEQQTKPRRLRPWRPTRRQVLWAVGTLLALVTIALLVALLVVNRDAVKWEDLLSRERIEQVALFIGIAVAVTTLIVLLAIGGTSLGWTGFANKTLWDWLQLLSALAIPVVLAAAGLWFTAQQETRQREIEDQRAKQAQNIETKRAEAEQKLAGQRTQDEALQAYLDQMGQLMLDRKLLEAEQGDPAHTLAQARTSTVILRLDAEHNASVIRFLSDSGLARRGGASVSLLREIVLNRANLSGANLNKLDLRDTLLNIADLSDASLSEADLRDAYLVQADLRDAYAGNTDLSEADLSEADLSEANLGFALLIDANLIDTNLSGANLSHATLRNASPINADLSDANLTGADLRWADLSGAEGVTNEELEQQAESLEGATLPNGQKYEDWIKDKEGRK